jgi:hypothetical protein
MVPALYVKYSVTWGGITLVKSMFWKSYDKTKIILGYNWYAERQNEII